MNIIKKLEEIHSTIKNSSSPTALQILEKAEEADNLLKQFYNTSIIGLDIEISSFKKQVDLLKMSASDWSRRKNPNKITNQKFHEVHKRLVSYLGNAIQYLKN